MNGAKCSVKGEAKSTVMRQWEVCYQEVPDVITWFYLVFPPAFGEERTSVSEGYCWLVEVLRLCMVLRYRPVAQFSPSMPAVMCVCGIYQNLCPILDHRHQPGITGELFETFESCQPSKISWSSGFIHTTLLERTIEHALRFSLYSSLTARGGQFFRNSSGEAVSWRIER